MLSGRVIHLMIEMIVAKVLIGIVKNYILIGIINTLDGNDNIKTN